MPKQWPIAMAVALLAFGCAPEYDLVIRQGTVYDGTGQAPFLADVAVKDDIIVAIAPMVKGKGRTEINAQGMAVAPGFINVLSWAYHPLLNDGRSMSNIKQGVTLEVFGEGSSPGPFNPDKAPYEYLTFGENMGYLEEKGVSCNIASFVGATTIREYVIGLADRAPTEEELQLMQSLVERSMQEGALGLGTSLIYPPAFFATTQELIALSQAAAQHGGLYISHLRSEGDQLLEAVGELITIANEANIPAEIYHLKASGKQNWHKIDEVIALIEAANQSGLRITTNMYNYTAASTGLSACMPPWCQDGGKGRWLARLNSPAERKKIIADMEGPSQGWENFLKLSEDPNNILLLGFDQDSLRYLTGKTLGEVSQARGMRPAETIVALIRANNGDISTAYFLMAEENLEKQLKLPYMSFGSDARSIAAEGDMLLSMTHPRTYGNFARLLGSYVRDKQALTMEEAIHKLTLLPAQKFHITQRGSLQKGYFADIVVFDPATITDLADYATPHQYAKGVHHVWVNGQAVLSNGEHTGAKPGRFVKGPGYVAPQ